MKRARPHAAPLVRGASAILAATLHFALLFAVLFAVAPAGAQVAAHPPTGDAQVPPPPPGAAAIRGTVRDPDAPAATAGLDVALYALRADGSPGIARAVTDDAGRFAFEGLSSAPDIVYLVGVRYAGVPYGERVAFAPGQTELSVAIAVAAPVEAGDAVRIAESAIEIEWRGTQIAVAEEHRLENRGDAVVYVPPEHRDGATPPVEIGLPEGHTGFQTPLGDASDAYEVSERAVAYWGPVYTGDQTLRFGYLVPVGAGDRPVALEASFPRGTGALLVRVAEGGPEIASDALSAPRAVEVDGRSYRILETGALAPGARVVLDVSVPETRSDPGAVALGAADVTAELDDTVLTVTQHWRLDVAPGAYVAGSPSEPLLRFALPDGADLEGLTSDASELGITPTPDGIDVLGPLAPGRHEFAARYRLPARDGVATLDLRFPRAVPTLSLNVADTGVVVESTRLHRLRPQQMGTRTWLLREAFQVEPSETVSVRFEALPQRPASAAAALAVVLGAGALLLFYVVRPLRGGRATGTADVATAPVRERELVYATIRDLDHDHETGKIADEDYRRTREELRARAIALLREERRGSTAAKPARGGAETTRGESACPHCGGAVDPAWTFCSRCGGRLAAIGDEPAA